MRVLCSISTRGRTHTTLPLAISAVITQTRKVDKLVIFDDNDSPEDVREISTYRQLFQMMNLKGIEWEWLFAEGKGQHFNHQRANMSGYDWVWRVDDDTIPEPNVLERLCSYVDSDTGAVGGSILTPEWGIQPRAATGKIEQIDLEPNLQWGHVDKTHYVDHLHCSFLYRVGVADYNLGLSRVAHREETLFTFALRQQGYTLKVIPDCNTWHLKEATGGIRSNDSRSEMYEHDEKIFRNTIGLKDHTVVVLNGGLGDHIVMKHVLPDVKNPVVFTCYPDIVPGRSIAEAKALFGDLDQFNIYRKMALWGWKDSLENAYRKMYV